MALHVETEQALYDTFQKNEGLWCVQKYKFQRTFLYLHPALTTYFVDFVSIPLSHTAPVTKSEHQRTIEIGV